MRTVDWHDCCSNYCKSYTNDIHCCWKFLLKDCHQYCVDNTLYLNHSTRWSCKSICCSIYHEQCSKYLEDTCSNAKHYLFWRVALSIIYRIIKIKEKTNFEKTDSQEGVNRKIKTFVTIICCPISWNRDAYCNHKRSENAKSYSV